MPCIGAARHAFWQWLSRSSRPADGQRSYRHIEEINYAFNLCSLLFDYATAAVQLYTWTAAEVD